MDENKELLPTASYTYIHLHSYSGIALCIPIRLVSHYEIAIEIDSPLKQKKKNE